MAKTKTEKVKKTKKVVEETPVEVVTPETVNTEDTITSFINNVQEEAFTQKESEALNLPLRDDVKKEETEDKTPEEVDNTPVEEENNPIAGENPDVEVKAEEDAPEFDVDEKGDDDAPMEDKDAPEEVITAETPTELQEDAKFDQPEDVKEVVEQPKKPKKRRTLQEMYGYDWLGQSYD